MLSEIKGVISPDILDFKNYWPENEECFSFLITVLVGPKNTEIQESFNVVVCTPQWLLKMYNENDTILGQNKLIVFKFDMERILARIKKLFNNCEGDTWNDIAIKLSRIGHWEFENYRA